MPKSFGSIRYIVGEDGCDGVEEGVGEDKERSGVSIHSHMGLEERFSWEYCSI